MHAMFQKMNNRNINRLLQLFILIITSFVLIYSYYLDYVQNLEPCLLCITQRFCIIGLLAGSILICCIHRRNIKWVCIFQMILALAGLVFSNRQLWLQSLHSDQLPSCLPGFNTLIQYFPWQTALRGMLWGSASCGEVSWRWLGLSLAGWSSLFFLFTFIVQCVSFHLQKNS